MSSTPARVHAGSDPLTPAILAAITPTSKVTHEDDWSDEHKDDVWQVVLDGRTVATFHEGSESAMEDAAMELRCAIEARIARMAQQTPEEVEVDARTAFAEGLRALADFLARTPGAPLPYGTLARHFDDADEFDAAVAVIGVDVRQDPGSEYEHAVLRFGPVALDLQTDGRAAQRIRHREAAIAAREAELGLTPADGAS